MTDREKLITRLNASFKMQYSKRGFLTAQHTADDLISFVVTFATDNNDGRNRIEELEAQLAEREKAVIQLRKQWQDAEMHICTMCGHFDHKTDGNIVYGNQTCGEICGYPFCKEKFTPWIPVSERLPDSQADVLVVAFWHEKWQTMIG